MDAATLDCGARRDNLAIDDLIVRVGRRLNTALDPSGKLAQGFVERAEVRNGPGGVLLNVIVAVEGVVDEPETETVSGVGSGMLASFGRIPVRLPREGLPVEEGRDDDHLAAELSGLDGPRGGLGEDRPYKEGTLGEEGGAVGVSELVPDAEVSAGDLVPVVRLRGEHVAVVDRDRVSGPEAFERSARTGNVNGGQVADH